jgi:hypothetical protein
MPNFYSIYSNGLDSYFLLDKMMYWLLYSQSQIYVTRKALTTAVFTVTCLCLFLAKEENRRWKCPSSTV